MGQRGFSLVELVVVLAIAGTLMGLTTMQFSAMQRKSAIEQQVTAVYGKLVEARLEALYTKTPRTVVVTTTKLTVYPTAAASGTPSGTPIAVQPLSFQAVMGGGFDRVLFDGSGLSPDERAICLEPGGVASNTGNIDSVVISAVKIHMGKRRSGGACVPSAIDQK